MMKLPLACKKVDDTIVCNKDGKDIKMKSCSWHLGSNSSCTDYNDENHYFKDVMFPPNTDDKHKIEEKTYATITEGYRKVHILDKDLFLSGHLGDIGDTGDKLVIKSYFNKLVVREIEVKKDDVVIKAGRDEPLTLPKNISIYYGPWFMDRGSYVFFNPPGNAFPQGQLLKLGTELDILEEAK